MQKKWKVVLLIGIILLSTIVSAALYIFIVDIDISYDPYSEYANEVVDERGILMGYEFIKTIEANDINDLFPEIDENEGDISDLPEYDIDLYRINYTSVFLYEIVNLSGLIVVPKKNSTLSHIQYHHGTMRPYPYENGEGSKDAPSLYEGEKPEEEYAQYESRLFGNYLGSYGYLVSLPDYIGHGVSDSYEHSYSVNDRLAEQSVDMILATREFCDERNITLKDELFLCGWSEGGAACLATQKLIESEYKDDIEVTANAPLAGFFALEFYSKLLINLAPLMPTDWGEDLDVLLWALSSINQFTDDKPLDNSDIFKFEVEDQRDVLKKRPTSIPSEAIRCCIKDRDKLISKFAQNDLSDNWAPKAPVYIHHGTNDETVPYPFNTEVTVNNLNYQGGDVELVKYEGHDHYTLDKLYLLNIIEEFDQY
ncbi:MAG: hypothetical protein EU533_06810 [Promethearchaeota archaeon]|nr:MAG: hypothetical protein EU533_06810 [Candidatus Lokiarchaeota archaeon]